MHYQKFSPSQHLAPFVECYFIWKKHDQLTSPLCIESPPTGFCSMVFNLGDDYYIRTSKSYQITPAAFLTGQATSRYELGLTGRIDIVGIVFRPAGLHSLFGVPMYEFTDERVPLSDVLNQQTGSLPDQIAEAKSDTERVNMIEGFLSRQLLRRGHQIDRTDYAANLIANGRGTLNVNALMNELYVCRRQFERRFLLKVGISPKYYARIRRVSTLCAQMATQRWQICDWHELVYQFNYYDQSHLIREFTQIMGKRPTLYLRNNDELTRYL